MEIKWIRGLVHAANSSTRSAPFVPAVPVGRLASGRLVSRDTVSSVGACGRSNVLVICGRNSSCCPAAVRDSNIDAC